MDNQDIKISTNKSRNNWRKGAISMGIIAGIMIFTNPSIQNYGDYAIETLNKETQNAICKQGAVCDGIKSIISVIGGVSRDTLKNTIVNATSRQNFLIFSIYTTEFSGQTFKTIGVFGNFITFSK